MESQFTSSFWHYYIIAIVVFAFIYIIWLLISQDIKAKREAPPKGQEAQTTGHDWDGIQEYGNPLPRWWFWMFIATIIFSIGYLIVYPGLGDFKGIGFGGKPWTSAGQYQDEVAAAEKGYKPLYDKYAQMDIKEVAKSPEAMTIGKNLFDTYCIQCHGSDAKGSRGFPNLTDTDWLFGGTPEKIHETIAKGRVGIMAPWGPILGEEGVKDAAHFVMSLSGKEHNEDRAARGKAVFGTNCAVCHGAEGKGTMGMAPNLTDDTWLWGGSEKAIIETITGGRHNQMPAWEGFLTNEKIHLLTAYVWGISHPDQKALPTDGAAPAPAAQPQSAAAASAVAQLEAGQASAAAGNNPTSSIVPQSTDASTASQAAAVPAEDKAEVVLNKDGKEPMATFYFATGKSDVATNAAEMLPEIVKAGKEGKKLVISGYTDSTGNADANAELSKKRAQAVQAFLESQGVDAKNIELRKPENTTAAAGNNAEGRRVEVKVEG